MKDQRKTLRTTIALSVETYNTAQDLAALYQTSVGGLFAMLIDAAAKQNASALEAFSNAQAQLQSLQK